MIEGSDILITITNSATPLFQGTRIQPGIHVNAAGSNFLVKKELDESFIQKCDSIVVDSKEQARFECGKLLGPIEKGWLNWDGIRELSEVVTARFLRRTNPKDITLFKSHGLALEVLAEEVP